MKQKRIIALFLALCMIFSMSFGVSAATDPNDKAHRTDSFFGGVFDGLFGFVGGLFTQKDIPDVEEYGLNTDEYFYEGTTKAVSGDSWKLGYASTGVIPPSWRRNADGKPDENGWNLNKKYYFGGYVTERVDKIYDDERVNLVVMSTGSDSNENGVEDIIIFAALDGIGFSNMSVRDVRKATEKALLTKGVTHGDIIGFNFNVTHAHSVIDPQGMGLDLFGYLFKNKLLGTKERSVQKELLKTICNNTASAVVSAYEKMEKGSLWYFETEDVGTYSESFDVVGDKNKRGSAVQSFFACFLFEGESGEKTILSNIGMHPTRADRKSRRVCADVPYYVAKAINEEGYNFVYIQGAQGAVGLERQTSEAAAEWAKKNTPTYEEWVQRYGKKYADKEYENAERNYFELRETGYVIAHVILDAISRDNPVEPRLNVKMSEFVASLDYGLIYLGAVSGLLGFNTVRYADSETGYGIATEIGIVELGDDIAMLMMPGEISPAIVFGVDEKFTGDRLWTGETSWSGEDWGYRSLEEYVRIATGDSDKRVIVMGIANDAIGYVFPDNDVIECFLSHSIWQSLNGKREDRQRNGKPEDRILNGMVDDLAGLKGHYEELLMSSTKTASAMVDAFIELLDTEK